MGCTPAQPAAAEGGATMLKNALNWAGENRTVVGVLCGAVLVMYGFYRGSVRLMKFFFNVSDRQIFEMGFLVGLITAVVIIVSGSSRTGTSTSTSTMPTTRPSGIFVSTTRST